MAPTFSVAQLAQKFGKQIDEKKSFRRKFKQSLATHNTFQA